MRVMDRINGSEAPPQNLEAERAVLGCLLLEPTGLDLVANYLKPSDFHGVAHGVIFSTMLEMSRDGTPLDERTLTMELRRINRLESAGGIETVGHLTSVVPSSGNVEWYATQVVECSHLRTAREALKAAQKHLEESNDPAHERLERVEKIVFDGTQFEAAKNAPTMAEILGDVLNTFHACQGVGVPGITTGFPPIDRMSHGLRIGEITILAGRPGSGKSTLAVNIAKHAAQAGKHVAFISLEMPEAAVARNLICSMGRVDLADLQSGRLNAGEEQALIDWMGSVEALPFQIAAPSSLTIMGVRALARRWKAAKKLDLLVLDYLQLLEPTDGNHKKPRHEQVSEISRGLKALASELGIPILAMAQLNRQVEERQGNRPKLSDLRESGSLEQDAALVMLIHREEYYMTPEQAEAKGVKNKATVIVAKNRYGPTGDVDLYYDKTTAFFGLVV